MSENSKKVLIVDDSESARLNLEGVFTSIGCEVVGFAKDGVQALAAIEQSRPDLVSLDVIMPTMDGIECFRQIKKRFPEVKCLIVSILSSEITFRDGYKGEIPDSAFVAKPIVRSALEARLSEIFASQAS